MSCTVRFLGSGFGPSEAGGAARTLEVPRGTTLLEAALRAGLPVARACGGDGLCGRCGLEILAGAETLAAPSEEEQCAKQRNRVPLELRLSCQVEVRGPLEVTASYW